MTEIRAKVAKNIQEAVEREMIDLQLVVTEIFLRYIWKKCYCYLYNL